jgi:hypothetical protein
LTVERDWRSDSCCDDQSEKHLTHVCFPFP